jgi:hypothetical protein
MDGSAGLAMVMRATLAGRLSWLMKKAPTSRRSRNARIARARVY